jgi:hypothetical protein
MLFLVPACSFGITLERSQERSFVLLEIHYLIVAVAHRAFHAKLGLNERRKDESL